MHAFDVRRLEWALTEGDRLVDVDPLQSAKRWTVVSLLLGALLVATAGVLGVVRSHSNWRDAELVLETDSGALFLNRDGVLHPLPNYTSALLVGSWGSTRPEPRALSAADLADAPRGSQLGVVGAPSRLPKPSELVSGPWSVCGRVGGAASQQAPDDEGLALLIGRPAPGRRLSDGEALLAVARSVPTLPAGSVSAETSSHPPPAETASASPASSSSTYLIWGGRRFAVDVADPIVAAALRLTRRQPSLVDPALLDLLPHAGPLAVPTIPGTGERPAFGGVPAGDGTSLLVGDVFVVRQAGGLAQYVVHRDGVEQISETTAELLKYAASTDPELPVVGPAVLARAPATTAAIGGTLPSRLPVILDAVEIPVVCAEWEQSRPEPQRWALTVAPEPPPATIEVAVPAKRTGVTRIGLRSGAGALARTVTTAEGASATVCFVSDAGIAFPLVGDALTQLGLPPTAAVALPAALIEILPKGPALELAKG